MRWGCACGGEIGECGGADWGSKWWVALVAWIGDRAARVVGKEESGRSEAGVKMVSASKEMAIYCFDTLVSHYTGDVVPAPGFDEGQL